MNRHTAHVGYYVHHDRYRWWRRRNILAPAGSSPPAEGEDAGVTLPGYIVACRAMGKSWPPWRTTARRRPGPLSSIRAGRRVNGGAWLRASLYNCTPCRGRLGNFPMARKEPAAPPRWWDALNADHTTVSCRARAVTRALAQRPPQHRPVSWRVTWGPRQTTPPRSAKPGRAASAATTSR